MRKLLVILFIYSANLQAQYLPLQTQYLFNSVALNPASTGSEDAFSLIGSFRAQWLGFPGAPMTQSLTVHGPTRNMKSALGFQIYADQIGVSRNTGIFGSYAYRLRFENSTLAFGFAAGINMIKTTLDELSVNDNNDSELNMNLQRGFLPDFSFGMHFYSEKFFISLSVPKFLTHDYSGTNFKLTNDFKNYNFIAGGGIAVKARSGMKFKPSVLFKYRYDARLQADINAMFTFNEKMDIGLSYRTEEALIVLIELRANKQFSFMYSFGFPLSPLWKYTFGSHEFSLKYTFLYKTKIASPRFLGW
ncbi:type IX secretion system membrane protein PorP/SprF [Crocinitomix catalasitica]|nr:type IX secretion system membrane protein PorP/SprF [Crocinitomix catalasitica]